GRLVGVAVCVLAFVFEHEPPLVARACEEGDDAGEVEPTLTRRSPCAVAVNVLEVDVVDSVSVERDRLEGIHPPCSYVTQVGGEANLLIEPVQKDGVILGCTEERAWRRVGVHCWSHTSGGRPMRYGVHACDRSALPLGEIRAVFTGQLDKDKLGAWEPTRKLDHPVCLMAFGLALAGTLPFGRICDRRQLEPRA